jgi:hypothetical protein
MTHATALANPDDCDEAGSVAGSRDKAADVSWMVAAASEGVEAYMLGRMGETVQLDSEAGGREMR